MGGGGLNTFAKQLLVLIINVLKYLCCTAMCFLCIRTFIIGNLHPLCTQLGTPLSHITKVLQTLHE